MSILFCYTFQTSFLDFTFSGGLRSSCLGGMVAGMAIRTGRAVGTGKMTGGSPGLRNGAGLLKHGVHKALSKVLGTAVVALPDRALTQDLPKGKGRVVSRIREENFPKKGRAVKTDKEFLDMLKSSHRDEKQCARSA